MARRSHARCRGCGKARHSYAKFGLCQTCWQEKKPEHRQRWRDLKARRAAKRLPDPQEVTLLAEEPEEITQLPPPGTSERIALMRDIKAGTVKYRRPLTPEQEVEMLDAYTRTDDPIDGIAARFNVRSTYIYNVLDRAGVSWRRNDTRTFDQWQAAQQKTVIETPKEPEVIVPETRTLPPQIEAMRAIRPAAVALPEEEGDVWEVTYTGRMLVKATSARGAIEAAERDGHITTIVGVNFRGRA